MATSVWPTCSRETAFARNKDIVVNLMQFTTCPLSLSKLILYLKAKKPLLYPLLKYLLYKAAIVFFTDIGVKFQCLSPEWKYFVYFVLIVLFAEFHFVYQILVLCNVHVYLLLLNIESRVKNKFLQTHLRMPQPVADYELFITQ